MTEREIDKQLKRIYVQWLEEIKETYENSLDNYMMVPYTDMFGNVYFDYVPIYTLPDPKVVTKAEGDALTYAFVNFISERAQ